MKTKNTSPKTAGSNKDKEPSLALKKPVSIGNYEELKMKNDAIITGEQQKITAGEHNRDRLEEILTWASFQKYLREQLAQSEPGRQAKAFLN